MSAAPSGALGSLSTKAPVSIGASPSLGTCTTASENCTSPTPFGTTPPPAIPSTISAADTLAAPPSPAAPAANPARAPPNAARRVSRAARRGGIGNFSIPTIVLLLYLLRRVCVANAWLLRAAPCCHFEPEAKSPSNHIAREALVVRVSSSVLGVVGSHKREISRGGSK